jgi:hypothetical protein
MNKSEYEKYLNDLYAQINLRETMITFGYLTRNLVSHHHKHTIGTAYRRYDKKNFDKSWLKHNA